MGVREVVLTCDPALGIHRQRDPSAETWRWAKKADGLDNRGGEAGRPARDNVYRSPPGSGRSGEGRGGGGGYTAANRGERRAATSGWRHGGRGRGRGGRRGGSEGIGHYKKIPFLRP